MPECLLPPSKAHIWSNCPGWTLMTYSQGEREPSTDQIEGRQSRIVAEAMVKSYARAGVEFPQGDIMDDCYGSAKMYADHVRSVMIERRIVGGDDFGVEQDIPCPSISKHTRGRFNCAILDRRNNELFLWVYRYTHRAESEIENPRAICYISGLLDAYCIDGKKDQSLNVTVTVVQPRCFTVEPIRQWKFKAHEIRGPVNKLREAAIKAMAPNAVCRSGGYCPTCDSRFTCNTAFESGLVQYEASMAPNMEVLDAAEVARRYLIVERAYEQISTLHKAYTQRVESMSRSGERLPGLSVERSLAARSWKCPAEEIIGLGVMLGKDIKKPDAPVTPAQALKMGMPEDLINQFTERLPGGLKIVPEEKSRNSSVFKSFVKTSAVQ
jgi:hypothetical protein